MAVDSKQGTNKQTLLGTGTPTPGPAGRRKRPSSLMAAAQALPNVENSLEEFIARANQTSVDAEQWGAGTPTNEDAKLAKEEDDKRKEQDALRWKSAEAQMRESEAREGSLRRQLDGLQGKLAEAEARAAVAGSSTGAMQAAEALVADLRTRLDKAKTESMTAQQHAVELQHELKTTRDSVPVLARGSSQSDAIQRDSRDSDERIRVAEAKAAKAIAAARAAQAGLTVSSADIAAIESGLVVTNLEQPKQTPWLWIAVAFVGGLALMLGVSKLIFSGGGSSDAKNVAAQPAPAVAPAPTPAPAPVVTPIDPPKAAVAAPVAAPAPVVTPIDPPAPAPAPAVAVEPAPVAPAPLAPAPAPIAHHGAVAAPAPHHATPAPAGKKPAGGIADPFSDAPAPSAKKPAPAAKKPAGGIADPFAN